MSDNENRRPSMPMASDGIHMYVAFVSRQPAQAYHAPGRRIYRLPLFRHLHCMIGVHMFARG
jgi:hypothetical protein